MIVDLEAMGMTTISLDVTDSKSIEAARNEVETMTNGVLDILVNNAYPKPSFAVPLRCVTKFADLTLI